MGLFFLLLFSTIFFFFFFFLLLLFSTKSWHIFTINIFYKSIDCNLVTEVSVTLQKLQYCYRNNQDRTSYIQNRKDRVIPLYPAVNHQTKAVHHVTLKSTYSVKSDRLL